MLQLGVKGNKNCNKPVWRGAEREKHLQNNPHNALWEELCDITFCFHNGLLFGWPDGQPISKGFISCVPIIGLQIDAFPVFCNDILDHLTNWFTQVTFLYQCHKNRGWRQHLWSLLRRASGAGALWAPTFLLPSALARLKGWRKTNHAFCKHTSSMGIG